MNSQIQSMRKLLTRTFKTLERLKNRMKNMIIKRRAIQQCKDFMQTKYIKRRSRNENGNNVEIKTQRKKKNKQQNLYAIQRILMAIPCAVCKVFRNTEKKKVKSYAGAGVTCATAHSYLYTQIQIAKKKKKNSMKNFSIHNINQERKKMALRENASSSNKIKINIKEWWKAEIKKLHHFEPKQNNYTT